MEGSLLIHSSEFFEIFGRKSNVNGALILAGVNIWRVPLLLDLLNEIFMLVVWSSCGEILSYTIQSEWIRTYVSS